MCVLRAHQRRAPPTFFFFHAAPSLAPLREAVACTGIIWSRYSTQITPVNYNLLAVNAVMACTGIFHLARMLRHEMAQGKSAPQSA